MEVLQTIPILRIFDVARAREFYLDYLGFRLEWEHRFEAELPLYMDATPGSTVFLRVTGLEAFHRELSATNYRFARPRFNEDLK